MTDSLSQAWDWILHTPDYGNVQEAITWLVALTALIYAARAARAALDTNNQLKESELERREQERTAQARSVAMWAKGDPPRLLFSNSSSLPVFNIEVTYHLASGTTEKSEFDTIPPTASAHEVPDLNAHFSGLLAQLQRSNAGKILRSSIEVTYTDQNGTRWSRRLDGPLTELGPAV